MFTQDSVIYAISNNDSYPYCYLFLQIVCNDQLSAIKVTDADKSSFEQDDDFNPKEPDPQEYKLEAISSLIIFLQCDSLGKYGKR